MERYVVLLRAINVGGRNAIPMAELRQVLTDATSFEHVASYLQSGNLVVAADANADSVATTISKQIKSHFSLDIVVFVRTRKEFASIIKHYPYADGMPNQAGVVFLDARHGERTSDLDLEKFTPDTLTPTRQQDVYVHCPSGFGKTKLTVAWIEKQLGCSGTRRNWKTVLKIGAMLDAI